MTKDGELGVEELAQLTAGSGGQILMGFPIIPSQGVSGEILKMEDMDLDVPKDLMVEHDMEGAFGQIVPMPIVPGNDSLIGANHATIQTLLSTPLAATPMITQHSEALQMISLPNTTDMVGLAGGSSGRVFQLVQAGGAMAAAPLSKFVSLVAIPSTNLITTNLKPETTVADLATHSTADIPGSSDAAMAAILMPPPMPVLDLPPGCPTWAMRLKRCEKIGDSYRGYVENEADLDLILTLHKQQTSSLWGTRQSPSPAKASTRLMWKSQYVPFDGIPFINAGSRAVVMECQYGPRRKGTLGKRGTALSSSNGDFKQTCPARIYIKKVRKFPGHAVNLQLDKKNIRLAMDKAFHELRELGLDSWGEERFYVQLPTEKAHDYHENENCKPKENESPLSPIEQVLDDPQQQQLQSVSRCDRSPEARIHPAVLEKIRQMVAMGENKLYTIRKQLRKFVVSEMFQGSGQVPERHDLTMFPTVNDLKNHIHQALKDIESGVLPLIAPVPQADPVEVEEEEEETRTDDPAGLCEIKTELSSMWSGANLPASCGPMPESVTVTLTQNPGEDGHHFISRIETHLSDGSTQVSTTLTPETAHLLTRLHPGLFSASKAPTAEGPLQDICTENPTLEMPSELDPTSLVEGVHILDPANLASMVGGLEPAPPNISDMMEEDTVSSPHTMSGLNLDTAPSQSVPGLIDADSHGFASIVAPSSESPSIPSLHGLPPSPHSFASIGAASESPSIPSLLSSGTGLVSVLNGVDSSDSPHLILPSSSEGIAQFSVDADGTLTLIPTTLVVDGQVDKLSDDKITLHLTSDQELGLARLENKVSVL